MYPEHLQKYIPPSFDLVKYDKAANMRLIDWVQNLSMRRDVMDDTSGLITLEILDLIVTGPYIVEPDTLTKLNNFVLNEDRGELVSLVRELTSFDVLNRANYLNSRDDIKVSYSRIEDGTDTGSIEERKLLETLATAPLHGEDEDEFYWLEIDLTCSDGEIRSAFSGWLKQAREQEKINKEKPKRREYKLNKFNQVAFRKWHNSRVIPYIDLVLWNDHIGNKITSKILADILFPDPTDPRDTTAIINDTVKPLANELTSPITLARMYKVIADTTRKKIT